MTILSVAYPLLPVSSGSAGGAEQILYILDRGLVRSGHRSLVIATEGSETAGELIATPTAHGEITDEQRLAAQRQHLLRINQALNDHKVDLIHFHGLDFNTYLPAHPVAKLATLHLPPSWYPAAVFEYTELQLNCVSQSQAAAWPGKTRPPVVPNGIDVEQYRSAFADRKYLLWMGRICPEKGVHIALEVAHRAGLPAIIAGPVHPFQDHRVYFSNSVQPLLDDQRRYVGPVGLQQKRELLAGAKCLLVPSLVAETSSLVAMEAISSGAPVIAFRSGALPEVVDHGVTGFIVDSAEEMLAALERLGEISPEECREVACRRFDSARMVEDYLKLYASLGL